MNEQNRCIQCGSELAADAPQGLCPACLLKKALETQSKSSGNSGQSEHADLVSPSPAELAAHFPELEILEFIGRGGMGMVYKARQKHLDRLVALKILLPRIGSDPAFAERFSHEARAMAMLAHANIVTVYDFGRTHKSPLPTNLRSAPGEGQNEGELYYFLMEFVDGVTLRKLLDAGKLDSKEALAIVPQICDALQYAHDNGVVHRDIKPENILLDKRGRVKIADFGLAKLVGARPQDATLTGIGQVMGTPHYMAPEQMEHPQEVDHRADIYSLGVVFYQMLTGELPLGRFAPPSKKVQIDVRLDEVVLRALEKEPEQRYQQASEIKTRVETIVTTPPAMNSSPLHLGEGQGVRAVVTKSYDWRSWVMGVGVRDGKKVINLPGLILQWPLVFSLCCILMLQPDVEAHLVTFLIFAVASAFVVVLFAWVQSQRPVEQLPSLDSPRSQQPQPVTDDAASEQARRQVKGPAIGLLIMGMINCIIIPLVILYVFMGKIELNPPPPPPMILTLASIAVFILIVLAPGIFTIFAALKMKRLEAYGFAVAAGILTVIVSPAFFFIGMSIGIWALVVLSQKDVRTAFKRKRATGSAGVLSADDTKKRPDTPLPSTGEASGTPALHIPDIAAQWSWKTVPWQIWVVVVLLIIEGANNLYILPTQPQAIKWILAKCLFIVGLLRGWKWVFVVFQIIAAIHVVGFLSPEPLVAMANLLLIVLTCSAYRFYFSRSATSSPQTQDIAGRSITRKVAVIILGIVSLVLMSFNPAALYESIWAPYDFGGQSRIPIEEALEEYRQTLIVYDLGFDSVFPQQKWTRYDAARLEMYPTKDAWHQVLGHVDTNPSAFKVVWDESKYANNPVAGPNAFMVPLDRGLVADTNYVTLLFLKGIMPKGTVVAKTYASLVCFGPMDGRLNFDSYATALLKGDVSGKITSQSYFNLVVTGKFSGRIFADSYAMIYLMGGCEGSLELKQGAKVYIARRTVKADLSRIQGKGNIYLEDSDLAPGEHRIGDLNVTVAKKDGPADSDADQAAGGDDIK